MPYQKKRTIKSLDPDKEKHRSANNECSHLNYNRNESFDNSYQLEKKAKRSEAQGTYDHYEKNEGTFKPAYSISETSDNQKSVHFNLQPISGTEVGSHKIKKHHEIPTKIYLEDQSSKEWRTFRLVSDEYVF